MASATNHAKSSANLFGGAWQDYYDIHNFFDMTREMIEPYWNGTPDFRHRALRHHDIGIDIAEIMYNYLIRNSDGEIVAVRDLGIQHMHEDFDRVPCFEEWWGPVEPDDIIGDEQHMARMVANIQALPWMSSHARVLHV